MSTNRGFTLIELAVVLAVIAILAAVLTPMVTGYIDQARDTRAAGDTRSIATAILGYQRDTSRFPVYNNITEANSDTIGAEELIGPGNAPSLGSWALGSSGTLDTFLNTNLLSLPTSGRGGRVAYRGPYIQLEADPWGNYYIVTASDLSRGGTAQHAFILSAGANQTIETTRDQSNGGAFTVGGDDVAQRIR